MRLLKLPADESADKSSDVDKQTIPNTKPPKLLTLKKKRSLLNEKTGLPNWKNQVGRMSDSESQHMSEGQVQFVEPVNTQYTREQLAYLSYTNRLSKQSNQAEEMIEARSVDNLELLNSLDEQPINTVNSLSENLGDVSISSTIDRQSAENNASRNNVAPSPSRDAGPQNNSTPENYLHMSPRRNSSSNGTSRRRRRSVSDNVFIHNEQSSNNNDSNDAIANYHINELIHLISPQGVGRQNNEDWRINALRGMIMTNANNNNVDALQSSTISQEIVGEITPSRIEITPNSAPNTRRNYEERNKHEKNKRNLITPSETVANKFETPFHSSRSHVTYAEWCKLKEQAELVMDENRLLLEQKMIYKKNYEDTSHDYQNEIKELSGKLRDSLKEKNSISQELLESQLKLSHVSSKYEKLMIELSDRVERSTLENELEEMKRCHQTEVDKLRHENENLKSKVKASFKEREILAVKLTNSTLEKKQLMKELNEADKYIRRAEKTLAHHSSILLNQSSKENAAKLTLSKVIDVAEQGLAERESLMNELRKQKAKTGLAVSQLLNEDRKMESMNKRVKKEKASNKKLIQTMSHKMKNQEKDLKDIKDTYLQELNELRTLVKEKEKFLKDAHSNQRLTSDDIEKLRMSLKS